MARAYRIEVREGYYTPQVQTEGGEWEYIFRNNQRKLATRSKFAKALMHTHQSHAQALIDEHNKQEEIRERPLYYIDTEPKI